MSLVSFLVFLLGLLAFGRAEDLSDDNHQQQETYGFKSETTKLMDIIVNSLYSNRDIFLRELLSNAADALEKARFISLKNPGILGEGEASELKIKVWYDKDLNELYIQDSGVGMNKDELINNLGTIAESGTKRFLEQQGQSADATTDLIGQFGVGFFSAYLVADMVYVDTIRTPESDKDKTEYECLRWSSNSVGTYTIEPSPLDKESLIRGTRLTLRMKEEGLEFLDFEKLKNLILEHSKFLPFPIYLRKMEEVEVEVEENTESITEESGNNEEQKETKTEIKYTWEHINDIPVLWLRDKGSISKDEYKDFFKNGGLGRINYEDPAGWIHFKGEGITDYTTLIYIPKTNPLIFLFQDNALRAPGLRLYINRVFVTDQLDIVPEYFLFATGILDTDNKLTINLSREMIQHSKQMTGIGRKITKKILEWIDNSSKKDEKRWSKYQKNLEEYKKELEKYISEGEKLDKEKEGEEEEQLQAPQEPTIPELNYFAFYANYGDYLKFGITKDDENKNELIKTLRYPSTFSIRKYPGSIPDLKDPIINVFKPETIATFTTLKQYVKRMEKRNERIIEKMREDMEAAKEEIVGDNDNDMGEEEQRGQRKEEEFDKTKAEPYLQKDIYYFVAPSFSDALNSPLTEQAQALGIEVLLFTNPIDSFMAEPISGFKGHKLVEISSKDAKFPEEYKGLSFDDDDNDNKNDNNNEGIIEDSRAARVIKKFLSETLSDNLEEVQFSKRLTSSPALLTMKYSNAAMRRISSSSVDAITRTSVKKGKYVMEINLNNPLISKLAKSLEELNDSLIDDSDDFNIVSTEAMRRYAHSLFDAALLQSGFVVDNVRTFSDRVYGLLADSLEVEQEKQ